jgi:hypothetical protein
MNLTVAVYLPRVVETGFIGDPCEPGSADCTGFTWVPKSNGLNYDCATQPTIMHEWLQQVHFACREVARVRLHRAHARSALHRDW